MDPYANNRGRDKPRFPYNGYDHQEQTFLMRQFLIRSPLKMNIRTPADSYKTWIYRSGSWLCTIVIQTEILMIQLKPATEDKAEPKNYKQKDSLSRIENPSLYTRTKIAAFFCILIPQKTRQTAQKRVGYPEIILRISSEEDSRNLLKYK